jgi:DNA (cytosine-5)-methyltransferase 1
MRTVAFCEIDSYCRAVLRKHWPDVPCFEDVRQLKASDIAEPIDVICGGFPCQDISTAGKGAGIEGERSGLWSQYARIIGEIRPQFVVVENVAALLGRGLERVVGDMAQIGYDAEWYCIPAAAVGAPHQRDRLWIVAYASRGRSGELADADSPRLERWLRESLRECATQRAIGESRASVGDSDGVRQLQPEGSVSNLWGRAGNAGWWGAEPKVGRVAYGIPARVDRLKSLGNAVVPAIPEIIGKAIMRAA